MFEITIKTYEFTKNFLKFDLKRDDVIKQDDTTYQINIGSEEELKEFISHCLFYSRLVQNIYLKKGNELIDLLDFSLEERDYKLNQKNPLNPILTNYCLYQLGLDEEENYTILDPLANQGDIIIETAIFASKKPLNLQKRTKIPYSKKFKNFPALPKQEKTKNKVLAFVQDNKSFKELKENIDYAGVKIRCSQYELDWLDVKFKEAEVDFAITHITKENEEKLDELLYMLAFVISDAILLISHKKIDEKLIKKHELEIEFEEKITLENQEYFITILN